MMKDGLAAIVWKYLSQKKLETFHLKLFLFYHNIPSRIVISSVARNLPCTTVKGRVCEEESPKHLGDFIITS